MPFAVRSGRSAQATTSLTQEKQLSLQHLTTGRRHRLLERHLLESDLPCRSDLSCPLPPCVRAEASAPVGASGLFHRFRNQAMDDTTCVPPGYGNLADPASHLGLAIDPQPGWPVWIPEWGGNATASANAQQQSALSSATAEGMLKCGNTSATCCINSFGTHLWGLSVRLAARFRTLQRSTFVNIWHECNKAALPG